MSTVWLNGELLPATEARLPALDRGVLWGYGLFETLRAYEGRVFGVQEHHARLRSGGTLIELPVPDLPTLRRAMDATLEANGLADAGVRITITRGAGPPEPHLEATGTPNVLVSAWGLPDYSELYERGVSVVTLPAGGRPLAEVKTTSYAASVVGRILARRAGADDALFCGPDGRVLEATGSNLFCVFGQKITTPPLDDGLLAGVTRAKVFEVARGLGFTVVEESLRLSQLFDAHEVLLTSSLREVYPVRAVDHLDVGRGEVATRLRHAYGAAVRAAL